VSEIYTNETHSIELPKYIGAYEIGNVTFHQTKKPSFINRFFCKWCLGFVWVDT